MLGKYRIALTMYYVYMYVTQLTVGKHEIFIVELTSSLVIP